MSYEVQHRRPPNGPLDFFLAPRTILSLGGAELSAASAKIAQQGRAELAVIASDTAKNFAYALDQGVAAILLLAAEAVPPELLSRAKAARVTLLGPDSLGLIVPGTALRLSNIRTPILPGRVAFVTQSGALGAAILDWAEAQRVGFSAFLSLGKASDIGFGACIDYLAQDYQTQSILLYIESIPDARHFLSAAREAALRKPVIVLKSGREDAQREAAFDAAFRRCGALRVYRIAELFSLAEVLSRQPRPQGSRLSILSNGNGPARLAADALRSAGGGLASLIDLGGSANADDYVAAAALAQADVGCDGVLAILSPLPATDPEQIAKALLRQAAKFRKPLLTSWMGGELVADAREALNEARIPVFPYPDTAARAFVALSVYASSLQALYETPSFTGEFPEAAASCAWLLGLRSTGVERLADPDYARLFAAFGLAWQPGGNATLSLRCHADPSFGPLLTLGAGTLAEQIYADFTAALPPLTTTLARRMIERLRIHRSFSEPALEQLAILLVRFSRLVSEAPVIRSAALSLSVDGEAVLISGAVMELQALECPQEQWPRCVVRPYPSQYVKEIRLRDGSSAILRPIRPEDETLIVDFHSDLSERSVYLRYLQFLQLEERILHDRLARVCFNDYDRELALVVEQQGRILGVGRMQRNPLRDAIESEAEVAFLVRDSTQGQGVGGSLVRHLVEAARSEGIQRLTAELLAANSAMRLLLERVGFDFRLSGDGSTLLARLAL